MVGKCSGLAPGFACGVFGVPFGLALRLDCFVARGGFGDAGGFLFGAQPLSLDLCHIFRLAAQVVDLLLLFTLDRPQLARIGDGFALRLPGQHGRVVGRGLGLEAVDQGPLGCCRCGRPVCEFVAFERQN